ncbi:MAG: hypothetical protein IKD77_02370 [Bacilli bacterium]|nr:hypothetical protein [Bacilli bacterium]MBR3363212.1 hypothetical protein [Bacilli bacterium]
MSKLIISCDDDEAITMAMLDRDVLDNLPTDQKYTGEMEEVLYENYGYGFLSIDEEKNFSSIPDYISEEDIIIWEAEMALYESNFDYSYPEAKEFVLKKK